MQDRYVGDIGDYVKLALLRALQPGRRLGVAWWLFPDESHNGDGRHVSYLDQPGRWRTLDPDLFDGLARIVAAGDRRVVALQDAGLLPGAAFSAEVIPVDGSPAQRRAERLAWFSRVRDAMADRDLVFLDPDNGLETAGYSLGAVKSGKCVSLAQLRGLAAPGRALVVYHHQTRRKGGHAGEIAHWAGRLRAEGFGMVDAVRSSAYSARAFFLLDASPDLRHRARGFAARAGEWLTWHPGEETSA